MAVSRSRGGLRRSELWADALGRASIPAGIVGAVLAVPLTAVAWSVLLIRYENPAGPEVPAPGGAPPPPVLPGPPGPAGP